MNQGFDELIDIGGLTAGEQQRLRRVHDQLVAAGPPPELTVALLEPPAPDSSGDNLVPFPGSRDRRAVWALIAAAVAVACIGGGYALGSGLQSDDDQVVRVLPMQGVGQQTARGSVSMGAVEAGGNWPIELEVTGLPEQSGRGYYELFVWRDGKPGYPCGGFKMHAGTTTVRFTVPYELRNSTELVVTSIERPKHPWPGRVVMRTT